MNRFKAWIKRPVNFNMASLLLVAAILLIFAAIGFIWAGEEELNSQTVSIGTILISLLNALALGFFCNNSTCYISGYYYLFCCVKNYLFCCEFKKVAGIQNSFRNRLFLYACRVFAVFVFLFLRGDCGCRF